MCDDSGDDSMLADAIWTVEDWAAAMPDFVDLMQSMEADERYTFEDDRTIIHLDKCEDPFEALSLAPDTRLADLLEPKYGRVLADAHAWRMLSIADFLQKFGQQLDAIELVEHLPGQGVQPSESLMKVLCCVPMREITDKDFAIDFEAVVKLVKASPDNA